MKKYFIFFGILTLTILIGVALASNGEKNLLVGIWEWMNKGRTVFGVDPEGNAITIGEDLVSGNVDVLTAETAANEGWLADTTNFPKSIVGYSTTTKYEGAQSLKIGGNTLTAYTVESVGAYRTGSFDLGSRDAGMVLSNWVGGFGVYYPSLQGYRWRFYTDGTNFFSYEGTGAAPPSRLAKRKKTDFTATGSPDWSNITKIGLRLDIYGYGTTYYFYADAFKMLDEFDHGPFSIGTPTKKLPAYHSLGDFEFLSRAGSPSGSNTIFVGPKPYGDFQTIKEAVDSTTGGTSVNDWVTIYVLPGKYVLDGADDEVKFLSTHQYLRIIGVNRPQIIVDRSGVFDFDACSSACGPFEIRGLEFLRGSIPASGTNVDIASYTTTVKVRGMVIEDLVVHGLKWRGPNTLWDPVDSGSEWIVRNVRWNYDPNLHGPISGFGPQFALRGIGVNSSVFGEDNHFVIDDSGTEAGSGCAKTHMWDHNKSVSAGNGGRLFLRNNYFEMNCCESVNDCEFHENQFHHIVDACPEVVEYSGNTYVLRMEDPAQTDADFHFIHEHVSGDAQTDPCLNYIVNDNIVWATSSVCLTCDGEFFFADEGINAYLSGNQFLFDFPNESFSNIHFIRTADDVADVFYKDDNIMKPDTILTGLLSNAGEIIPLDCTAKISVTYDPTEAGATNDHVSLVSIDTSTGDASFSATRTNEDQFFANEDIFVYDLFAQVAVAPGAGNDPWVIELLDDGVNSGLTCTISGTNTTCESGLAEPSLIAKSSKMNFLVKSSGANPDPSASEELFLTFCRRPSTGG